MIKKALILIFSILILIGCNSGKKTDHNNSSVSSGTDGLEFEELTGNYGENISEKGAVPAREVLSKMSQSDSIPMKVEGEILATCKMKGCWMNIALSDNQKMRVTFKDYGFFVPQNGVEGKTAIMKGYVKKVITDVETQKHFAKDAGKPQAEIDTIIGSKEEIAFVATGVIIK